MGSAARGVLFALTLASAPAARAATAPERMGLREAVARALARNPSVHVAAAEVRRAAAVVEQVRAAALPTLTGNGVYTRLDDDRRIGDQVFVAANQFQGNLTLSVPVLVPARWAAWAQAAAGTRVAALGEAEVRRRVAIAAAHAYLAIVAARRQVELGERARDTAQAHHEYSQKRLSGGVGSQLDEVRAAQELSAAESRLEILRVMLLRAQGALGVLVGEARPVDAVGTVDLGDAAAPAETDPASLLQARADLASLEAQRLLAQRLVRDMWTYYLPTVVGAFVPLYQNPATIVQPQLSWQAQLLLSVPLYDGGLRYGLRRERSARLEQASAGLDGALRQAQVDVDVGRQAQERADRAAQAARRAAELARRAMEIAELSYRAGATTNLELIDAQRRARDADTAAAVAEDDARRARLELLAASGRFP